MDKLILIAKEARITQWVKNIVIFAPIVFSGFLFEEGKLPLVVWAFFIFCILSSAIYILNDIVDLKKDREHPFKKNRPIASGKLSMPTAIFLAVSGAGGALFFAYATSFFFFLATLSYFFLNIFYSLSWKRVPILDVFAIAAGFVLRVYAGSFVINVHMDVWFLLTVVSASLFLAVGKRRSEMTLLEGAGIDVRRARSSLLHYTPKLLDAYTGMFANTTWLTYALFSFLHPAFKPEGKILKYFILLPQTLVVEKLLMATVPLVIYGVMRYMQLIYEKNQGESPHKVLMTDVTLITVVGIWGILVLSIIYLF